MDWRERLSRHSELLLVLGVLIVISGVFHWIPDKLAFLSFFYLPVLGAGYKLGARRAVLTGVLCVLVVTIYYFWAWTRVALATEEGIEALAAVVGDNVPILLHLALWGGFLILTGALVGRVQERSEAAYEKAQALNKQLAQRAAQLQKLNEALTNSAEEIRQKGEELQGKDLLIEELKQHAVEPQSSAAQRSRRRSDRVFLVVPVDVMWMRPDGQRATESAETEVVNGHGALLRMRANLPLKTNVVLTHRVTQQSTSARVVGSYPAQEDGKLRIAVGLEEPSGAFWGVSIPISA